MAIAKGWHETLIIAGIVIAGVVEAIEQALASAPNFTALFPAFLHGGFWHYVPLIFLIAAGLVWLHGKMFPPKDKPQLNPARLVIHGASYGFGPNSVDVTEKLRAAVRDALVIPVDNNLVNRDPIVGVRKRLVVDYSYGDGIVRSVSRMESMQDDIVRLVLPEDSEIAKLTAEITRLKRQLNLSS
jgi:hypothetical protein